MTDFYYNDIKFGDEYEITALDYCEGEYGFRATDEGRMVLLLRSEEGEPVTIHAGDGVFAGKDKVVELNKNYKMVLLETGPYMVTKGPNKGRIIISGESFQAGIMYLA